MKLVWAVDPFVGAKKVNQRAMAAISALAKGKEVEVHPVYVLTPEGTDRMTRDISHSWLKSFKGSAEKALSQTLSKWKQKGVQNSKVLVQDTYRLRDAARSLDLYAQQIGADYIVVSSHSRKGLPRLFLGSFAETLLLTSSTPVYVVNPRTQVSSTIKSIVFPTDLGKVCRQTFEEVVTLAAEKKARITLLHHIPSPIEPMLASGAELLGGSYVPVKTFFDERKAEKSKEAYEWKKLAEDRGVKCKVVLRFMPESIAESVVRTAKKERADLIAVTAQAGRLETALLGSVSRQVVRNSDCPVLVLTPGRATQKATKPKRRSSKTSERQGSSKDSAAPVAFS